MNQKLHGIAFEDAKFVFNDPFKIILPDLYHSEKEERWLVIGIVGRVLFVVFTERGENIIIENIIIMKLLQRYRKKGLFLRVKREVMQNIQMGIVQQLRTIQETAQSFCPPPSIFTA